jgi:hypothetical protein
MDVHDNLKVKVIEAVNLLQVNGAAPSTFVEVVVGPDSMATREVRDTTRPKYGHSTLIFDYILGHHVEAIQAYVYHRDPMLDSKRCLGVAIIPMDTFYSAPKVAFDYWYDLIPTSNMDERIENSRLRLEIAYDNAIDGDLFVPEDGAHNAAPNFLQATILGATNLPVSGNIEAVVEIKIDSFKKATKVCRKSDKPVWNETLEIPAIHPESFVDLYLKQVQVMRSVIIGRTRIALNEIAAAGEGGYSKVLILYGEHLDLREARHGELEVLIKWVFDEETERIKQESRIVKPSLAEKFSKFFKLKSKTTKTTASAGTEEDTEADPLSTVKIVGVPSLCLLINSLLISIWCGLFI